jgi:hypothetical protein
MQLDPCPLPPSMNLSPCVRQTFESLDGVVVVMVRAVALAVVKDKHAAAVEQAAEEEEEALVVGELSPRNDGMMR